MLASDASVTAPRPRWRTARRVAVAVTLGLAGAVLPATPAAASHTITAVEPNTLGQGGSRDVVIKGTGFSTSPVPTTEPTVTVSGGNVTATVKSKTATELTVTVTATSAAALGPRDVTVTQGVQQGDSATCTGCLTITAPPTVTAAAPSSRGQGALSQTVTLTGTGFAEGLTGDNVTFSGEGITVTVVNRVSATQLDLTVDVQEGAATGARDITVKNPDAGSGKCTGCFTVNPKPTLTSVEPAEIARGGRTALTVRGSGFAESAAILIGGDGVTIASVEEIDSGTLLVTVDAAVKTSTDPRSITIVNPDGGRGTCDCATVRPVGGGLWLLGSDGGVFALGSAPFYGSTGDRKLNEPVVAMGAPPAGDGYWFTATDGGVFAFGAAPFHGSMGAVKLNKPVVGMASAPDGKGYWLVATDGGIFAFGSARFHGSTGNLKLNRPVVGMAATPDGGGYWLVASDGGIFAFGNARFFGSTGGTALNDPIVGMAADPDGNGYKLLAADGAVFTYRGPHFGSANVEDPRVATALVVTPTGRGQWIVDDAGVVRPYGDAADIGIDGLKPLNPVIGAASARFVPASA